MDAPGDLDATKAFFISPELHAAMRVEPDWLIKQFIRFAQRNSSDLEINL